MTYYRQLSSSLLVILFLIITAQAADIIITVKNIKSNDGVLNVGMWDSKETFTNEKKVLFGTRVPANIPTKKVTISDLKPGKYAISVFHDKNKNQKLDRNLLGIPQEPYGFSNDARGAFGPPKFEQAQIEVGDTDQNIEITIK